MHPALLLTIYCLLAIVVSLAGGCLPLVLRLTHTRLQLAMSFVSGIMLGVGLLHLLPHAFFQLGSIYQTVSWLLGGFLAMFFVQRVFHFHHHGAPAGDVSSPHAPEACEHDHDHAHPHGPHAHAHASVHMRWPAALVGLTLHSVLDGLALAASLEADYAANAHGGLAGFGVLLVVLLHKPFDSLTLATLLAIEHSPRETAWLINVLYAFSLPVGAVAFYFGVQHASDSSYLLGAALAFAGGTFLCISTSDLLPELQFHSHDKAKLSAALLAGLAVAALIVGLEERTHDHRAPGRAHDTHHENDPGSRLSDLRSRLPS